MRRRHQLALLCATLWTAACGQSEDSEVGDSQSQDVTETEAQAEPAAPRKGSTIDSPSVEQDGMYWGERWITGLKKVGDLTGTLAKVADRADGLLANTTKDGMLGVDELANLEREHQHRMLPDEKAAIVKLWKILHIKDAPQHRLDDVSVESSDRYTPADVYQHPIASLPDELQETAMRVELVNHADGDNATISGADVAGAFDNWGSFLGSEKEDFNEISMKIDKASPQIETPRTIITGPAAGVLVENDFMRVNASPETTMSWWSSSDPTEHPKAEVHENLTVEVTDPAVRVFAISWENGSVATFPNRDDHKLREGRKYRIEVWKEGARVEEFDVDLPADGAEVPFGDAVTVNGVDKTLAFSSSDGVIGNYSTKQSWPGVYSDQSESYRLVGKPTMRVDVFSNGGARIVDGDHSTICYPFRSAGLSSGIIVKGCNFAADDHFPEPGQIQFQYRPGTSNPVHSGKNAGPNHGYLQLGNFESQSPSYHLYTY